MKEVKAKREKVALDAMEADEIYPREKSNQNAVPGTRKLPFRVKLRREAASQAREQLDDKRLKMSVIVKGVLSAIRACREL